MEIWSFLNKMGPGPFMSITEQDGKRVYEYKPQGYVMTKIVTASSDHVLITCYDTRR